MPRSVRLGSPMQPRPVVYESKSQISCDSSVRNGSSTEMFPYRHVRLPYHPVFENPATPRASAQPSTFKPTAFTKTIEELPDELLLLIMLELYRDFCDVPIHELDVSFLRAMRVNERWDRVGCQIMKDKWKPTSSIDLPSTLCDRSISDLMKYADDGDEDSETDDEIMLYSVRRDDARRNSRRRSATPVRCKP